MAKPLVPNALWAAIEPLLPPEPAKPKGGRPRVGDRAALAGIIFVLRSGIPWEMLPAEIGCSGMTCWRRLRDWQAAGVWTRLHRILLERLTDADKLDWSRAALDSSSIAAKKGAATGPNPTDRGKPGTKRHVVVDRTGTPLGISLSGANRHDSLMLAPTLDAVPPVRHGRGRPRRRPAKLHADKAYDHSRCRAECRRRSIVPRIARRSMDVSERLGRYRWVVLPRTIFPVSASSGQPWSLASLCPGPSGTRAP
jgi:transposase